MNPSLSGDELTGLTCLFWKPVEEKEKPAIQSHPEEECSLSGSFVSPRHTTAYMAAVYGVPCRPSGVTRLVTKCDDSTSRTFCSISQKECSYLDSSKHLLKRGRSMNKCAKEKKKNILSSQSLLRKMEGFLCKNCFCFLFFLSF